MPQSIAIVGAGVIGLATAWRLAARGAVVDVFDAGEIPGGLPLAASWASAGFLAPSVDDAPGTRPLDALNHLAAGQWPAFAAELHAASGVDVALRTEGTLVVALDDAAAHALRESFDAHSAAGGGAAQRWLDADAVAALEPALAGAVVAARWSERDVQVDNRLLVSALAEAARRAGARLHARTPVSLDLAGGAPRVVVRPRAASGDAVEGGEAAHATPAAPDGAHDTARGETPYDAVLVAAGAWSATIDGLPAGTALPVRPVAGQMLALRMPADPPLLRHVVVTPDVYLVPRRDGRLLVGATVEERGFDAPLTAGGVHALLAGARRALPAADVLPIAELWSGLRPGSPDGAPLLGWLGQGPDRVAVAAGHYRNGILLTPVTADAMAALLLGAPTPDWLPAFAADRFGG
jgi:glycine oxidase